MSTTAQTPRVMSYSEFCNAYWASGYQWPYPVPFSLFEDPDANASYREFVALLKRRGKELDSYNRGLNLIRAIYDYLAGTDGERVELPQILTFLSQPWQDILTQLTSYQPVFQWLLGAHMLLESEREDVFRVRRVEGAIAAASYEIKECLA